MAIDEGISALDPAKEQFVNAATTQLGVARNIIACRLTTIISVARILKMGDETIVDITVQFSPFTHNRYKATVFHFIATAMAAY